METIEKNSQALAFLKDPQLFVNITERIFSAKFVGEQKPSKAIFLSMCSIYVMNPQSRLHCLVNSESSTGKSFVCKSIFDFFPGKLKQYRTKISPEALTYWHSRDKEPDWTWDGKILYLEDIREGVVNCDAFKVMCSEGSIATVVKNQNILDIEIAGKPLMLVTTAQANPNTEVLNRFNLIDLDESQEQTIRIVERQAQSCNDIEGDEESDFNLAKGALQLLNRVEVIIPYSRLIAKFFPTNQLRARRDFPRFLDLIKSSAALHQQQREKNTQGCIIADENDYQIAKDALENFRFKAVFGLPHRLKKAYDSCLALYADTQRPFSAKEIWLYDSSVNQKTWYIYLQKLCELNLLKPSTQKMDNIPKPVTLYYPSHSQIINLPEYQTLTNTTLSKNTTITTITTNALSESRVFVANVANVVNPDVIAGKNSLQRVRPYGGLCSRCGDIGPIYWAFNDRPLCHKCKGENEQQANE